MLFNEENISQRGGAEQTVSSLQLIKCTKDSGVIKAKIFNVLACGNMRGYWCGCVSKNTGI